ncbi:MAG: TraR/DksA family transcriptional regulator [Kiritimatiellae bacterium]|nr:TraR/DksA family transcriptional regulator [Kiritimatiellia bacterium]
MVMSEQGVECNGQLSEEELEAFRAQLISLRNVATGNMNFLRGDSLKPVRPEDEDEDSFDHDFALSVAGSEQNLIKEIDEALRRMDAGVYGICEMTDKPISKARLVAIPYARYCIEAQTEQEGGRPRRRVTI